MTFHIAVMILNEDVVFPGLLIISIHTCSTLQLKALVKKDGGPELLIVVNPQWETKGFLPGQSGGRSYAERSYMGRSYTCMSYTGGSYAGRSYTGVSYTGRSYIWCRTCS